ncbi:polysaccharide deacetylase family protein [Geodermatophilus sp. SYSU D01045]
MYHSVAEDPTPATRRLAVSPPAFAEQAQRLADLGFTTLTFSALADRLTSGAELPERPVALTFDDGYADFHSVVFPILRRHGLTATVFVTTGWLADAGASAAGRPIGRMLSRQQLAELSAAGIEIGGHSHSHPQLDQLQGPQLAGELQRSKELLEEATGRPVEGLAYPYGYTSPRVREAVAASGYRFAAVVANTCARAPVDPLAVPRLTIRRTTTMQTFEQLVGARGIGRTFLLQRTLTRGFAVVRRGHRLARRVGRA